MGTAVSHNACHASHDLVPLLATTAFNHGGEEAIEGAGTAKAGEQSGACFVSVVVYPEVRDCQHDNRLTLRTHVRQCRTVEGQKLMLVIKLMWSNDFSGFGQDQRQKLAGQRALGLLYSRPI
jgi:hypothetical protein